MTATFVITGTNVSISFTYSASTAKVIETVKAAVKSLYATGTMDQQPTIPFEQLTDQQVLDYLDEWILQTIISKAREQLKGEMMGDAVSAAIASVNLEIDAKFLPSAPPVEPIP